MCEKTKEGRKKERKTERPTKEKKREMEKKSGSFPLCNKYKVPLQTLNVTKV
jgi:hypothetical protein